MNLPIPIATLYLVPILLIVAAIDAFVTYSRVQRAGTRDWRTYVPTWFLAAWGIANLVVGMSMPFDFMVVTELQAVPRLVVGLAVWLVLRTAVGVSQSLDDDRKSA